ncbi:MAG: hypothetical protein K2W94_02740 [Alphaproteobacteria bacterium]|nr:hypothetical protein [Alphaproteobacteria bacterium]
MIERITFDPADHFREEVSQYILYYNQLRPHQIALIHQRIT